MEYALSYPAFIERAFHDISQAVTERTEPSLDNLIDICNAGIQAKVALDLWKSLGASKALFSKALGVSTRTFERYIGKPGENLKSAPSDRLLHLMLLAKSGTEVFGDFDVFKEWMHEPNDSLEGNRPVEYITTQFGIDAVRDLLVQIEWGELS